MIILHSLIFYFTMDTHFEIHCYSLLILGAKHTMKEVDSLKYWVIVLNVWKGRATFEFFQFSPACFMLFFTGKIQVSEEIDPHMHLLFYRPQVVPLEDNVFAGICQTTAGSRSYDPFSPCSKTGPEGRTPLADLKGAPTSL